MMDRRSFLHRSLAGGGLVFVPKLANRFIYRQSLIVPEYLIETSGDGTVWTIVAKLDHRQQIVTVTVHPPPFRFIRYRSQPANGGDTILDLCRFPQSYQLAISAPLAGPRSGP